MVKPDDDDCVTTGKERVDRQVQTKNRFEPLQLDVKCPDTAILLLGSRERPVLVAAAAALTKFAAKGKDNLQKLFELDIVENLLPLLDHNDLFTRRFAARLLAEMTAMSFVKNFFLESEFHLPRFINILITDSDVFMKEYASLIIAELSKYPYGAAKLLEHCLTLDFLFENLKISDPDVKKNNIEIMNNLLKDLTGANRILESQAFSFPLICQLLQEPFPEIQKLALSTLESLVARSKDDHIQQLFRESGAQRAMLDLLDNVEFSDLHSDILRVLMRSVENSATAESLVSDGEVSKLFTYFENCTNSRESKDILEVFVRLANIAVGRETLHNFGIVKHFLQNLRGSLRDQELSIIACHGIGMMSRYQPASKEIIQENPTKAILDILKDESLKWPVRESAAFTLKELCMSDQKNCLNFMEIKGPTYLQSLLKRTIGKVPLEIGITAVDILTIIGGYPDLRKILVEVELIDALCASFEAKDRASDELKIASCRALGNFCVEKRSREILLARNFVKKLFDLLVDVESTPIRAAAVQLVQQFSSDPAIAEQFLQAGYLNYMLKNRSASTVVPTWNTCIDALFSAHLPVKFAATGRISLHENTQDGFYVMRRHTCPFPILDELFRLKMCPMEPIYVVNFADPRSSVPDERSRFSAVQKRHTSLDSASAWLKVNFGKLRKDPYLCEYLELFKCILAANEPVEPAEETRRGIVDISKIASRAKLLGKFVARQLSGPDPRNPCIDHQLDIHVREIREDIETSVIPLGQLRVGSYLERALLFKVIADRICLPATLVRGEYGKAWNEIAIPQIENPVDDSDESRLPDVLSRSRIQASTKSILQRKTMEKSLNPTDNRQNEHDRTNVVHDNLKTILPTILLQKNYIVDLMEKPGDLLPIRSSQARTYCAPVTRCVMTCEI